MKEKFEKLKFQKISGVYFLLSFTKETWLIGVWATFCLLSHGRLYRRDVHDLVNLESVWCHYVQQQPPTAVPAKAKANIAKKSIQSQSFMSLAKCSISKWIFAGYTGSKNQVWNRQKIKFKNQFPETEFSKFKYRYLDTDNLVAP